MSMYSKIDEYINCALRDASYAHGHLAGNGAVAELEDKLCRLYGAKHALCVDSATNGLLYLFMATGLQHREILTSPLSFGGTIAGALALDCKIHFSDIDNRLDIHPQSVAEIIDKNHNIKAVIAVDFAGNPHDMRAIHNICQEYGIWHFVDAAQSLGADYVLNDVAKYNDALVVSFGSGKTVFSGGKGGAIITDNTILYNKLISVCQHPHRQERDIGIGLSNEFALNGGIHPLAALIANEMFDDGITAICEKQRIMNSALAVMNSFSSVSSILVQEGSTFYHCPFVVRNKKAFVKDFQQSVLSKDFYYERASFIPLPLQIERLALKKNVHAISFPQLEKILKHLYILHKK